MATKKQTGAQLIATEREKQIKKHGFTGKHHTEHPEWYDREQLIYASSEILNPSAIASVPVNWNKEWFLNLTQRSKLERLAISGALIAAELDRLIELEK